MLKWGDKEMHIKTLGTGSSGNTYLLTNKAGHTLIVECGVPAKQMLQALNYSIMEVDGAIISHVHSDHAGYVKQYEKYAIPVWRAWEDAPSMKVFGDFTVVSFELPHDGTENRGFVIRTDGHCLLYMTDFLYSKFTFTSIKPDTILCECNHQTEYLDSEEIKYQHSVQGHCDLETCKEFLKANVTDNLKQVVLIHPSRDWLEKGEALARISEVLPESVNLRFAEVGKTIEI